MARAEKVSGRGCLGRRQRPTFLPALHQVGLDHQEAWGQQQRQYGRESETACYGRGQLGPPLGTGRADRDLALVDDGWLPGARVARGTEVAIMDEASPELLAQGKTGEVTTGGTTILEAAENAHIKIPTLCKHPDLPPTAGCGICVVKIAGRRDPGEGQRHAGLLPLRGQGRADRHHGEGRRRGDLRSGGGRGRSDEGEARREGAQRRTDHQAIADLPGDAPKEAICPRCGGKLTLRSRKAMNNCQQTYFWRHRPNQNRQCRDRAGTCVYRSWHQGPLAASCRARAVSYGIER